MLKRHGVGDGIVYVIMGANHTWHNHLPFRIYNLICGVFFLKLFRKTNVHDFVFFDSDRTIFDNSIVRIQSHYYSVSDKNGNQFISPSNVKLLADLNLVVRRFSLEFVTTLFDRNNLNLADISDDSCLPLKCYNN